jgi:glyoxylase-like metal-dependent hydrolase (beta-lactamase superfamily II)/rhodanese-related sulfurtransferase
MKIEQIYTGCLAQGAYFIHSDGEAIIIDPLRETKPYIERAAKEGVKIKYILETHFHADFVSGHIDLARETGAKIVFGPGAKTSYEAFIAEDGQELQVGKIKLKVLHTPGHTLESSCFLLLDESNHPHAVFTGDTLFIGDVGRPDLAVKSNLTQEDLAGKLYDSLRSKILPLPDSVLIYPAHGAGSACGKNLSKETWDTLGNQKKKNYALGNISKEEFIKELTSGILPPPQYFPKNALLNKEGYAAIDSVIHQGSQALSPIDFEIAANAHAALILDVRSADEFAKAHIPNAIFIGIDGQFAPWVGALITDLKQPILLVTPKGREEETVIRLARVGYDNAIGYLHGGMESWIQAGKEIETVHSISAAAFADEFKNQNLNVLDVRKPGEYQAQHLENVDSFPLDYINDWHSSIDKNQKYHVHCAGGYRSMIACSILKSRGFTNLVDVAGGYGAISKTDLASTAFVCPTTKK